jgi:hypothetical protein
VAAERASKNLYLGALSRAPRWHVCFNSACSTWTFFNRRYLVAAKREAGAQGVVISANLASCKHPNCYLCHKVNFFRPFFSVSDVSIAKPFDYLNFC